jgi:hypothetical protein
MWQAYEELRHPHPHNMMVQNPCKFSVVSAPLELLRRVLCRSRLSYAVRAPRMMIAGSPRFSRDQPGLRWVEQVRVFRGGGGNRTRRSHPAILRQCDQGVVRAGGRGRTSNLN